MTFFFAREESWARSLAKIVKVDKLPQCHMLVNILASFGYKEIVSHLHYIILKGFHINGFTVLSDQLTMNKNYQNLKRHI